MISKINFGIRRTSKILKFDSKDGCLRLRNEKGLDVKIKKTRLTMQLAQLKVGWVKFLSGEGPVWRGTADDPSPGPEFALGFSLAVEGEEYFAELSGPIGVAEVCSTSGIVRESFSNLYNSQYCPQADDHLNELPIVELSDWRLITTKNGKFYSPVMNLVGWSSPKKVEAAKTDDLEELLS